MVKPRKLVLNTKIKLKSSTSINSIIENRNKTKKVNIIEEVDPEKMPKTSFTPDDLEGKWARFCHETKKAGKDSLYATLVKRKPKLGDNHSIELIIDNKVQEDYIGSIKPDLMEFLRTELNNYSIQLNLKIEVDTEEKSLYTGKEKFEKMMEKNPHLKTLQNKLKLLID